MRYVKLTVMVAVKDELDAADVAETCGMLCALLEVTDHPNALVETRYIDNETADAPAARAS